MVGFILDDLHQLEEVVEQLIVGQGLQTFDRVISHLKRDECRVHRAEDNGGGERVALTLASGNLESRSSRASTAVGCLKKPSNECIS